VVRGQRRGTPPRQSRWKRSLGFGAGVVVAVGAIVVGVGAGPAVAKNVTRGDRSAPVIHGGRSKVAFTHPADNSRDNSVCTPRLCPHTNNVWSGYVLTPLSGRPFRSISASWVQTAVTCPEPDAWALFWVGLDGWSTYDSQTVEQGGSSAECVAGASGHTTVDYEAWWEMFPTNSVMPVFPIAVGDHISASVVYSPTAFTYTITVADTTSGESFVAVSALNAAAVNPDTYTVTITDHGVATTTGPTPYGPQEVCNPGMPCQNTSAEWVVEAPGGDNGGSGSLYPLARFRTVIFTGATATDNVGDQGPINAPSYWANAAIDLTTTNGQFLAAVGRLTKKGSEFRDVWIPST
jgi:hypothetical protein